MNIELGKNINPREIETKIQEFWDNNTFWNNDVTSNKPSFCIMMPPLRPERSALPTALLSDCGAKVQIIYGL